MPERQIPWRRVATELDGYFQVRTGLRVSYFRIDARLGDARLRVRGESTPYSLHGGKTEIRIFVKDPLGGILRVARNLGQVSMYRRFLLRDVVIGDPRFDHEWIINAKREAHAQAFLGEEVRSRIAAVPAATSSSALHVADGFEKSYYEFDMRGRDVMASADDFEKDAERLTKAIDAALALARRPEALLTSWGFLASQLGGRLEYEGQWSLDGSTYISFPMLGSPVILTPAMVKTGWGRDRLRTRVSCECLGDMVGRKISILPGDSFSEWPNSSALRLAMAEAQIVRLEADGQRVRADMDGNVTDVRRVHAAATLVASVARGGRGQDGPYR